MTFFEATLYKFQALLKIIERQLPRYLQSEKYRRQFLTIIYYRQEKEYTYRESLSNLAIARSRLTTDHSIYRNLGLMSVNCIY